MIRLSKLTDYGFVLLTRFAVSNQKKWLTARDLSETTGLPLPTVSKLLKTFSRGGVLEAHRGANGGYSLARPSDQITVADVIEVIDGPIGLTDCTCDDNLDHGCVIEDHCPTKPHWIQISQRIKKALSEVTLTDLSIPVPSEATTAAHRLNCQGDGCESLPGGPCTCGNHQKHFSGDKQ